MNTTKPVIIFDVNETLLDMTPLKKKINALLDSNKGFRIWFGMLLHYSLVDNCTNNYHNFTDLADATLEMAAKALKADVAPEKRKEALQTIKQLTAYDDVPNGLQLLKDEGFRLATLTNSPPATLSAQLQSGKISRFFDATLSIDAIKKYKPALETYRWAADQLSVNISDAILVAAHGWDVAGALQAGMQAAFIERKGQSLYPLSPKPAFIAKNVTDFAKQMIAHYK